MSTVYFLRRLTHTHTHTHTQRECVCVVCVHTQTPLAAIHFEPPFNFGLGSSRVDVVKQLLGQLHPLLIGGPLANGANC